LEGRKHRGGNIGGADESKDFRIMSVVRNKKEARNFQSVRGSEAEYVRVERGRDELIPFSCKATKIEVGYPPLLWGNGA